MTSEIDKTGKELIDKITKDILKEQKSWSHPETKRGLSLALVGIKDDINQALADLKERVGKMECVEGEYCSVRRRLIGDKKATTKSVDNGSKSVVGRKG